MRRPENKEARCMNRTLTITRKKNLQASLGKLAVKLDGQVVAKIDNGETQSFPIDERSHEMELVMLSAFGAPAKGLDPANASITAGKNDCTVTVSLSMGLIKSRIQVECTYAAPKDQGTSAQAQAEQHAARVMELAGQYLKTGSEQASEELVDLYETTEEYCAKKVADYEGVKAIHAHMLALRYVNEAYNPSKALAYAHIAELAYTAYLPVLPAEQQKTTQVYLYQVWQILAYVDYVNDDLHGAYQWLKKIPPEAFDLSKVALSATVLFRLAYEEGQNERFSHAFKLFLAMDQMFTEPVRYPFEEDILRSAYSLYEMYYGDKNVGQQVSVAYDPNRSVAILTRARDLLKDSQQKAWLQEDIDKALAKAQAEA